MAHHDSFHHALLLGGKAVNDSLIWERVLLNLPQFHSAVICFLAFSVYFDTLPVVCALPVSAEIVDEARLYASSFTAPNNLAAIA